MKKPNLTLPEKIMGYQPNQDTTTGLSQVHFLALIGPTGIGKNTVARELVESDGRFKKVISHTTREPRMGEVEGIDYYFEPNSKENLRIIEEQVDLGSMVQIARHPTAADMYWSNLGAWNPGGVSLLDTLPDAVMKLREITFGQRTEIMLTAQPEEWQGWFAQRVAELSQDKAEARKKEAMLNIEWGLEQDNAEWVVNRAGKLRKTARRIIDIVDGNFDNSRQARLIGEKLLRSMKKN